MSRAGHLQSKCKSKNGSAQPTVIDRGDHHHHEETSSEINLSRPTLNTQLIGRNGNVAIGFKTRLVRSPVSPFVGAASYLFLIFDIRCTDPHHFCTHP